jgi:hypothetical protein
MKSEVNGKDRRKYVFSEKIDESRHISGHDNSGGGIAGGVQQQR